MVREKKRAIIESTFSAAHEQLAAMALCIARTDWQTRDLSPRQLREALQKLITRRCRSTRTYRTAKNAL